MSAGCGSLNRAYRGRGIAEAIGAVVATTDDDVIAPVDLLWRLTDPLFEDSTSLAVTTGNCLALKVETEAEALFEAYGGQRQPDRVSARSSRLPCSLGGKRRSHRAHLWLSRGETAFLTLIFAPPSRPAGNGRHAFSIPWRLKLLCGELGRRPGGGRRFSRKVFWAECAAYLAGP